MATKKSEGTKSAEAPVVTFESIAVDLLTQLVANGRREHPIHDMVIRALDRVAALANEAEQA